MKPSKPSTVIGKVGSLLRKLSRDRSGNTLAMVAAGLAPLLALIGGGIDMSRSYLSESRLQQACDAGVLAARKKMGAAVVDDGQVPADAEAVGNSFFNINFRTGAYGSENRTFEMALEEDFSISGIATVDVPTTLMRMFGNDNVPVHVECVARLNFNNTDVMLVLDTTGSMNRSASMSDPVTKIQALREVVKSFHAELEAAKTPGTRVRYGFVPYSMNVNVGNLLRDDWVVDEWGYQSRENASSTTSTTTTTYTTNWVTISGSSVPSSIIETYAATWRPSNTEGGSGYYECPTRPADTGTSTYTLISTTTEPFIGPPAGTRTIKHYSVVYNGTWHAAYLNGTNCNVHQWSHSNLTKEYDEITDPAYRTTSNYNYRRITRDVSNWRSETNGCIEERSTYEIADYGNVDLNRALDLNIDLVPTAGNPDTQWRPMYPGIIYNRKLNSWGGGGWSVADVMNVPDNYLKPIDHGWAACPTAAGTLDEMDATEVANYVNSLVPAGYTYHDIGMIWGGRLLSPDGLFATENADVNGKPTSRHLIFLTDGQTDTLDVGYTTYGVEPLDRRRWRSQAESGVSLNYTVEQRFLVACNQVRNKNITVWIIAFGTSMSPIFEQCAGADHSFTADNADELAETFSNIVKAMGELRIAR